MEKYGFVYIWRDRKHKRYYIGSHWGTETDGYLCSSNWMRDAHKRRPHDFKRRILARVHTSKQDLLVEEGKWLALIPKEEIGKKYYNLHNSQPGHWTATDNKLSIGDKIKIALKGSLSKGAQKRRYENYGAREVTSQAILKYNEEHPENVAKFLDANKVWLEKPESRVVLSEASKKRWAIQRGEIPDCRTSVEKKEAEKRNAKRREDWKNRKEANLDQT
jgi:hypothetical protein